jgi:hypothetical protein
MRLLHPLPAQRMTVIKHPRPNKAMKTTRPQLQSKRLLRKMHTVAMTVMLRRQRLIMMRTPHLWRPQRMLPPIRMPRATLQAQSQRLLSPHQTIAIHR